VKPAALALCAALLCSCVPYEGVQPDDGGRRSYTEIGQVFPELDPGANELQ
jgi:hypothetical protein